MTEHYTKEEAVELARECGLGYYTDAVNPQLHALINTAVSRKLAKVISLLSEARDDCDEVLNTYLPHAGWKRYDRRIAYQQDLLKRIDAAIEMSESSTFITEIPLLRGLK